MNGYRSAWQGAAEGINSGIDNAIKLYSAKNAQEDQAYKQTLRQRADEEYANENRVLGTYGDIIKPFVKGESTQQFYEKLGKARGYELTTPVKVRDSKLLYNDLIGDENRKFMAIDATRNDLANSIKAQESTLGTVDKKSPLYLELSQRLENQRKELSDLSLLDPRNDAALKRQAAEQTIAASKAEEKRKESTFPLEQEKTKAEIQKIKAQAAAEGRTGSGGEGGLTPAQRLSDQRAQINSIQAQADDARAIIVAQLKGETDPQMKKMLNDGLGKIPGHVKAATEAIRRGQDYTGLQEFNTWLANPRTYQRKGQQAATKQTITPEQDRDIKAGKARIEVSSSGAMRVVPVRGVTKSY